MIITAKLRIYYLLVLFVDFFVISFWIDYLYGMIAGISAAILSGGNNLRNGGRPKCFETIDGMRVIDHQLAVLQLLFSDIVFVSREGNLLEHTEGVREVSDVFPGQGPLAGIHAALIHVENHAVFVVAADMPFLEKVVIEDLYAEFKRSGAKIFLPYLRGGFEPLHAFYSTDIVGQVEECIAGGRSPRIISVLKKVSYSVKYFDAPVPSFRNINAFLGNV